jgi:hypothetical protein
MVVVAKRVSKEWANIFILLPRFSQVQPSRRSHTGRAAKNASVNAIFGWKRPLQGTCTHKLIIRRE